MQALRKLIPGAVMAGATLMLGSIAAIIAPPVTTPAWAQAPTPPLPTKGQRARKAYEEHLRKMDEAEKAGGAKPAARPLPAPAPRKAAAPAPASTSPAAAPAPAPAPLPATLPSPAAAPPAARSAMSATEQDTATERGLDQYRRMMKADPWSNPALLDADRGEALWAARLGPGQVSLAETCDLGKGVGVVEGAFAEMPRYFKDADRVQDTETRILWCMQSYQDFNAAAFRKNPHPGGGQPVREVGAIATFIATKSAGMKIASKADHPKEKEAIALGEQLFFRRQGPFDFSCATCHAGTGKRIRLQPLPFLSEPKEAKVAIGEWPAYRVSTTHVMTMQHRLLDCYWQMRLHRLDFGSDVSVALSAYLYDRARDGEMAAPGVKR